MTSLNLHRVAAFAVLVGVANAPLQAQTIGVNAGSTTAVPIAPNAKLTAPIVIDLTNAGATNIASLAAGITWGAGRLTFDSVRVVTALGWGFTPNTANQASGSVSFTASNATALGATATLASVFFTASATTGGTRVVPSPTAAANAVAASILALIQPRALDVCVAVRWGDANGDDNVNIIDAQQIARFTVSLNVLNPAALAQRGDVTINNDGVNIIDAQQIARFSVGLSVPAAPRINTFMTAAVASATLSPSAAQNLSLGGTVQITATPLDAVSADLTGCASFTWASSNPAIATVTASGGFVTGAANGTATITATSATNPAVTASVSVTVCASICSIVVAPLAPLSGNQTTTAVATARDAQGNIVAAAVTWSSSRPMVARVASNGAVQALGTGTSTITATVAAVSGSALLTVSQVAQAYTIEVRGLPALSPGASAAFTNAAARWSQIIRGDVPDVPLASFDVSAACLSQPAGTTVLNETIDDVLIYASVGPIDGVGQILGQAGPCFVRGGSLLPLIGVMRFDEADIASMETSGILTAVILHEMGHVLGIGTMWPDLGLLANPAPPPPPLGDPTFTGVNAQWAFQFLGTGYAGAIVPVENCCLDGTRNAHWRETVLSRELMTGFVTDGVGSVNPLSPLTAASLIDLGYVVDVAQSDVQPWFLRAALAAPGVRFEIKELRMPPPVVVDSNGRRIDGAPRVPGGPPVPAPARPPSPPPGIPRQLNL